MTLRELYRELEAHDWYYMMSDDSRVYERGNETQRELKAASARIPGGLELFDAFQAFHGSGPAWGTPKKPKPNLADFTREWEFPQQRGES
jgi:hypothetical protein